MIILLIIISIIGFLVSCVVIESDTAGFFLMCSGVLFVIAIFLGVLVSNGRTIDEKIAMYKEENTKIEKQIDTLVSNYMDYESDVYEKFKSESSITLVSMYPELKSDKLVNVSHASAYAKIDTKKHEIVDYYNARMCPVGVTDGIYE